jgi:hypothetical protein
MGRPDPRIVRIRPWAGNSNGLMGRRMIAPRTH